MRSYPRLSLYIFSALFVWLIDSIIFSATTAAPLLASFWGDVPSVRLLVRLGIVIVLFMTGFARAIMFELRKAKSSQSSKQSRQVWHGTPKSAERSQRLLYYCQRLADIMGLSEQEKHRLSLLCYSYEIGLIGVPDGLLNKNHVLTQEEKVLKDKHLDLGADIALSIPHLAEAADLLRYHEEYFDGSGAKSLYGRSIPLACRIFTVARMYDFYVNPHKGGRALNSRDALSELSFYNGTILDPDVFEAFSHMLADSKLQAKAMREVYSQNK